MFTATLKQIDDNDVRLVYRVIADTLEQAERYLLRSLEQQFGWTEAVLIHKGNLVYHVYNEGVYRGLIRISLE